jgi:hypothetical protein
MLACRKTCQSDDILCLCIFNIYYSQVSLHLYSPPLKELEYKDKKTGTSSTRPVVCYSLDHSSNNNAAGPDSSTLTASPQGLTPGLRGTVFTNLDSFARLCDLEFEQAFAHHSHLFQVGVSRVCVCVADCYEIQKVSMQCCLAL